MSTATIAISPTERRKTGMEALTAALGYDGAIAFLDDLLCAVDDNDGYQGIPGWNYTKWRKEQPEPTPEEFEAEIMRVQIDSLATGQLAGVTVIHGEKKVVMEPKTTKMIEREVTKWLEEHPDPTTNEMLAESERVLDKAAAMQEAGALGG